MIVSFFSNFLNHHQIPLCNALYKSLDHGFAFVATTPFEQEKEQMGYRDENNNYPYVFSAYDNVENEKKARHLIDSSDVVIMGSVPRKYIRRRARIDRLLLRYSERQLRSWKQTLKIPFYYLRSHILYASSSTAFLLCASAYTANDYKKIGLMSERAYKWGYFPETKRYELNSLLSQKDKTKILWVGRFLDLKHPDDAIRVARRLKDAGYDFSMDLIGTGVMEEELKAMTEALNVGDHVRFLGPVPSDQVRGYMEGAGIYLFTSDRQEGWGAVLNESMNSGCAVVASHAIGAVPYLMKNSENGLVYHSGNVDELFEKVKYLLDHHAEQERLGRAAYETITGEWNAEVAAKRLIDLTEHLLAGEKHPDLYRTGPCSRAEIIKDNWFDE